MCNASRRNSTWLYKCGSILIKCRALTYNCRCVQYSITLGLVIAPCKGVLKYSMLRRIVLSNVFPSCLVLSCLVLSCLVLCCVVLLDRFPSRSMLLRLFYTLTSSLFLHKRLERCFACSLRDIITRMIVWSRTDKNKNGYRGAKKQNKLTVHVSNFSSRFV